MLHEMFLLTLVLLIALVILTALAARWGIPYAILLVVGGTLLGLIPNLPHIELDPDIILLIFLPPLIYSAAWFTSWRDFRQELWPILLLAIGLVLVTTLCVATVAHLLIPGFSWPSAFVLGAVVSPTDTVAAEAVIKRLGLRRRVAAIIEGESLVNDATALVAYSFAIAAVSTGSFSVLAASGRFVVVSVGGIALGLLITLPATWLHRWIKDISSQIIITILTAFAAYLLGETLGVSGVLAVVAAGLLLGRQSATLFSADMRIKAISFWDVLVFLLNGLIFLLIGLQLGSEVVPTLTSHVYRDTTLALIGYAALISLVVIVVRLVWSLVAGWLLQLVIRWRSIKYQPVGVGPFLVVGWSGMRGGVSMATALAIPLLTSAGTAFPDRLLIIFLTFGVILSTLIIQGLSLGPLIRWLHLDHDESVEDETRLANRVVTQAALDRLTTLKQEDWVPQRLADRLYEFYEKMQNVLSDDTEENADEEEARRLHKEVRASAGRLHKEIRGAQRQAAIQLRNSGKIDDAIFRTIEHEFDLEEQRLRRR